MRLVGQVAKSLDLAAAGEGESGLWQLPTLPQRFTQKHVEPDDRSSGSVFQTDTYIRLYPIHVKHQSKLYWT